MRLAVVNLKGGTGKTTSATALAWALSTRGRTLLVDTDPQGSALAWSEEASFPFPTIGLPVRDVHTRLIQVGADYEHIVIDTPSGDESADRAQQRPGRGCGADSSGALGCGTAPDRANL